MRAIIVNFLKAMLGLLDQVKALGFPDSIEEAIAFVKSCFKLIGAMSPIYIIVFAAVCGVIAFTGYKLFKMGLFAVSAVGMAYAARTVAPFVVGYIQPLLPEYLDATVLLMVVAAIVGAILARYCRKFLVLCLGGLCGYFAGSTLVVNILAKHFSTLTFMTNPITAIIIGALCAAICGVTFILVFQHLWIILSAVGGMASCGLLAGMLIMPAGGKEMWMYFIGAGVVVSVLAIIHQYQDEMRANDIFYSFTL